MSDLPAVFTGQAELDDFAAASVFDGVTYREKIRCRHCGGERFEEWSAESIRAHGSAEAFLEWTVRRLSEFIKQHRRCRIDWQRAELN